MHKNIGVYKITNIINNKCYIGSSITLHERILKHKSLLLSGKHHSSKLQRSYNKYGIENFKYEILENCNKEETIGREQYWMDLYNPELNILKIAGSCLGCKRNPEGREKRRLIRLGMKHTQEAKDKMSKTRTGVKRSKESIQKMIKTNTGRFAKRGKHLKSVYQLDLQDNIINEFISIREASRQTGIARGGIQLTCKNIYKHSGGFKWRYKND